MSSDKRTKHIAEEYDKLVDFFAQWNPSPQFREIFEKTVLGQVRRRNDGSKEVKILEVGCGHGTWIKYLLDKMGGTAKLRIKGFDISKERIRLAKSILADYPNVSLEVDDAKRYSAPEQYDLIFFIEVFSLFTGSYYISILCRYLDLLAENGSLIVIDKEKYSLPTLKIYLKRELGLYHRTMDYVHYPSFRSLSKTAEKSGFKVMDKQKVGVFRGLVLQRASN